MPPGSVFQGSVAELFAALGLDTSNFDRGLKEAPLRLERSAQEMKRPIQAIQSLLSQLSTQAGPKAAVEAFDQLTLKSEQTRQSILRLQRELWSGLASGRQSLGNVQALTAQQALMGLGGEGLGGGGGLGQAAAFGGGGGGGGAAGSTNLVTRLTERFLIYQGLRLAVQGVSSALHEADDITRRMDQTGWGSRGVQLLTLQAERLHAPVDQATAAIARFEEKIDSGDNSALKALDRLGLKFTDIRKQMAADPQGTLERVFGAMNQEKNQGAFADNAFALFQDRSGKMLAFIKEYDRLKADAEKSPLLSDEDRKAVENLTWLIQQGKQAFQVGLGKMIGAASGAASSYGDYDTPGYNLPQRKGNIELKPTAEVPPLGGPNAPDSGAVSSISNLLDKYRSPKEMAGRQMKEDWDSMLLYERQGVASHAQLLELKSRIELKSRQEAVEAIKQDQQQRQTAFEKERSDYNAMISNDVRLLDTFDVKRTRLSKVALDFSELTDAFRQNRITVEEMTDATDEYFARLTENAARPTLREVMRLFESGRAGIRDIERAVTMENERGLMTGAENAFLKGQITDWDLLDYRRRYRGFLQSRDPMMFQPNVRNLIPDQTMPYGSLNIVPLDQFSEQMLRLWKQQGLTTR